MERLQRRILAASLALAGGTGAVLGALALRDKAFQRYDAAEAERYSRRAGDDLVPDATVHNDHGVTVDSAIDELWPRVRKLAEDSGMSIEVAEPPTALVVRRGRGMTVGFYLSSRDGLDGKPKTRLHVRERHSAGTWEARLRMRFTTAISTILTWSMLRDLAGSSTGDGDDAVLDLAHEQLGPGDSL